MNKLTQPGGWAKSVKSALPHGLAPPGALPSPSVSGEMNSYGLSEHEEASNYTFLESKSHKPKCSLDAPLSGLNLWGPTFVS